MALASLQLTGKYFSRLRQIARFQRQTDFEDELNALASAVILGRPQIVKEGFPVLDVQKSNVTFHCAR